MEKRIPRRRFKEFVGSGPWEEKKIRDIFRITRGNVLATTMTSKQKSDYYCYPVYSSQTLNNGLMGYYNDYLYEDSITWTTDGANAGTVKYRSGKFYCTNVCGVLLSNEGYSNKMVAEILNKVAWQYVSKVGNPKLMNNIMGEIIIKLPSLAEQEKIGNFFQKLDRLIDINREKLDKLKASKSAYLTEMFPGEGEDRPRRRFQGFTGDWEEKKLGEVAQFGRGRGYSKNDLKENGTPIILYGSLYTDYKTIIKKVSTFTNPKSNTVYSLGNEVILPSSGETAEDIVRASVVEGRNIILGGDLNILYLNYKLNPIFLSLLISYGDRKKEIIKKVQGNSVVHLYNDDLKDVNISFPSLAEQEKIGDFFKKLDQQIGLQEEKLEKLEKMKKAYLAEMFV